MEPEIQPVTRWLTVAATAEKLGINRATLYRWSKADPDFPQPSYALGQNNPRYRDEDIDAYMLTRSRTTRRKAL